MAETGNVTPKFWFDYDGRRYGARFLTIGEQAQAQVEVERHTNGNHSKWMASESTRVTAMVVEFAVYLNKAIVAWPVDIPPIDFLQSDDIDYLFGVWEAYGEASKKFRESRRNGAPGSGQKVAEGLPAA